MPDIKAIDHVLHCLITDDQECSKCNYFEDIGNGLCDCHARECVEEIIALLKEQELEIKGLRKLVEWAVECDFGYDNLGDWWVDRFKSEIEGMSYTEGLIHLAKRYIEVFEEDSEDA